jgi:hypothetical protein
MPLEELRTSSSIKCYLCPRIEVSPMSPVWTDYEPRLQGAVCRSFQQSREHAGRWETPANKIAGSLLDRFRRFRKPVWSRASGRRGGVAWEPRVRSWQIVLRPFTSPWRKISPILSITSLLRVPLVSRAGTKMGQMLNRSRNSCELAGPWVRFVFSRDGRRPWVRFVNSWRALRLPRSV